MRKSHMQMYEKAAQQILMMKDKPATHTMRVNQEIHIKATQTIVRVTDSSILYFSYILSVRSIFLSDLI